MKFKSTSHDDVVIVWLAGRFDASSTEEFKSKIGFLIDSGTKKIVLELSEVSTIDSSGLGCLVKVMRSLQKAKGKLNVAAPTTKVRNIFELTRLHRVFDIYDSAEAAARSFS